MLLVLEGLVSCQSVPGFKLVGHVDVGSNLESLNDRNFSKHDGHEVESIV